MRSRSRAIRSAGSGIALLRTLASTCRPIWSSSPIFRKFVERTGYLSSHHLDYGLDQQEKHVRNLSQSELTK